MAKKNNYSKPAPQQKVESVEIEEKKQEVIAPVEVAESVSISTLDEIVDALEVVSAMIENSQMSGYSKVKFKRDLRTLKIKIKSKL